MNTICYLTVMLGLSAFVQRCDDDSVSIAVPDCVEEKIEGIREAEVWNPPAKVYRYRYEGQTVYYIPSRCCDIPSQLYNSECEQICSPDGGFTGQGDGMCADFLPSRRDEVLIWEDKRKN